MLQAIRTFAAADDGAVTVDWVVLTAAIVGLGIAVVFSIGQGTGSVGSSLGGALDAGQVAELNFPKF